MSAAGTGSRIRILVVRLGAMGDILHALPAVASLKHSYPGSHLTWAVEPQWTALLEGNPFIDRLVLLRRGSLPGLWKTWRDVHAVSQHIGLVWDIQAINFGAVRLGLDCPDPRV